MDCWDNIVRLHFPGGAARTITVKSSTDAARLLVEEWPVRDGKCYRRAVMSCSAAVQGRAKPDLAQWSFVVAAMEAALSYELIDRLDSEIAEVCLALLLEDQPPVPLAEPAVAPRKAITRLFAQPMRRASDRSAR